MMILTKLDITSLLFFLLPSYLLVNCDDDITTMAPSICATCSCIGTSDIYTVDCMNLDLKHLPSFEKANRTSLWRLEAGNNLIQEIKPFPLLYRLASISLKHNDIIQIADSAFKELPQLRTLNLSHNKLNRDALFKDVFRGKYSNESIEPLYITSLDLSYNDIDSLNDDAFKHLTNLSILILDNNHLFDLTHTTKSAFSDLSTLSYLSLSQTGLDRLPPHFLADLRNLKTVILSGNKFKTVPSEINYIRTLKSLNLNANPIQQIVEDDFSEKLEYLEELQLSGMDELVLVGEKSFAHLKNLRHLQLTENKKLTIIDPTAFRTTENMIEKLEIQGNALTSIDKEMLPWLKIKQINIQNNPWNCDCNMEWVKTELLPHLERTNPTYTLNIVCATPQSVQGIEIKNTEDVKHDWKCTSDTSAKSLKYQRALVLTVIVVGAILLLIGTIVFAHLIFKNSQVRGGLGQSVQYRRTFNDEESFANDVHS